PFDAVFDRSVEVTFNARPLGRGGEEGLFCLASPQRSAHVYAQSVLPAGTSEEVLLALRAGVYDVNAVGVAVAPFVASANNTLRRAVAQITDGSVDVPDAVGTGELQLLVENRLDRDAIVRIEDGRWPDTLVTAAEVTAMQEFRDLFSSEVLAPGLELGIESLAILFTDLVGSTALYSRAGDAPAFRIVTNHFDAIRDVVARYEGTIVKTIGDAVMAVFVDPVRCFDAALELDACVTTIESDGMPLRLRVGFHSGPCIAMRANDRIDYFGTNVNLAARLQSVAEAGQVTMGSSDAALPAIAARIAAVRATIEKETLDVKGFSNAVDVVRVTA
ncbi:MAG: adenylate/guanylate cyclase domain-containing protein, partial [Candidatus Eremiobacteraeota bacterium]|nr:adenylate/guanylate cyclase domain-containing protein [Candidatus Eremiobacteraeota bacterium]